MASERERGREERGRGERGRGETGMDREERGGGLWVGWCKTHRKIRGMWCFDCKVPICRQCPMDTHRGHRATEEDDEGGRATRWAVPEELADYFRGRGRLLDEIIRGGAGAATVRRFGNGDLASLMGSYRGVKELSHRMREEAGGRQRRREDQVEKERRKVSEPGQVNRKQDHCMADVKMNCFR